MKKQCFGSYVGKLDCGTSPADTIGDRMPMLTVCSVLEKINEVIGMKNIRKGKIVTQVNDGIL